MNIINLLGFIILPLTILILSLILFFNNKTKPTGPNEFNIQTLFGIWYGDMEASSNSFSFELSPTSDQNIFNYKQKDLMDPIGRQIVIPLTYEKDSSSNIIRFFNSNALASNFIPVSSINLYPYLNIQYNIKENVMTIDGLIIDYGYKFIESSKPIILSKIGNLQTLPPKPTYKVDKSVVGEWASITNTNSNFVIYTIGYVNSSQFTVSAYRTGGFTQTLPNFEFDTSTGVYSGGGDSFIYDANSQTITYTASSQYGNGYDNLTLKRVPPPVTYTHAPVVTHKPPTYLSCNPSCTADPNIQGIWIGDGVKYNIIFNESSIPSITIIDLKYNNTGSNNYVFYYDNKNDYYSGFPAINDYQIKLYIVYDSKNDNCIVYFYSKNLQSSSIVYEYSGTNVVLIRQGSLPKNPTTIINYTILDPSHGNTNLTKQDDNMYVYLGGSSDPPSYMSYDSSTNEYTLELGNDDVITLLFNYTTNIATITIRHGSSITSSNLTFTTQKIKPSN